MTRNKILAIACFLTCCMVETPRLAAQNVANWGLSHPQDVKTLPRSKSGAVIKPTVKEQTKIDAKLEKVGNNDYLLSQGWRMCSGRDVITSGKSVFDADASAVSGDGWYNATVPGTVLTTLVDQGVYADPYFGLNNLSIPDTLCRMDWWYRFEFETPVSCAGKEAWLLFNGINYQAEIWLNGLCLGTMKGAFMRGEFDATRALRDGKNVLAVHILPPPNPGIPHEQSPSAGNGMNGGQLCLDGPTFISSEGWDWVPGIRDRNIGIWQDVHLRFTEGVRLHDTQVITRLALPDTTQAFLTVRTEVENVQTRPKQVAVNLDFEGKTISKKVDLSPGEKKEVCFLPSEYAVLKMKNPRLWWPNNYGAQALYTMGVSVSEGEHVSDVKQVRFGVRELTYELEVCCPDDSVRRMEFRPAAMQDAAPIFDNINRKYVEEGMCMPRLLKDVSTDILVPSPDDAMKHYLVIRVNGRRIFCKGGNWGMDDGMKRVSREHLEPYFRLHKEANFNMIRNWTGESTEEVFYQLCDEYGMLVFNDFWLSTQGYNMPVNDDDLFLRNAEDVVKRFRNHPSIAIWNPRNEGFAPEYIEKRLAEMIARVDGTRYYTPNSTHCNLRPSGPWNYFKNPVDYYTKRAHGFNTEQGSTSIPTYESILDMMSEEDAWPISDVWYYHDLHGGQNDFMNDLEHKFGKPSSLVDFNRKAQILNYDSHRAMFEAWNSKLWNSTSGLLLWMSHPAWPSMVWQIYSWDYEPFGSFYGCRKACEPIHIQKNLDDDKVVVVNLTSKELKGVTAIYEVYGLDGKRLYLHSAKTDVAPGVLTECFSQPRPERASGVYMERLTLKDRKGNVLSTNDYWKTDVDGTLKSFNSLPKCTIEAKLVKRTGDKVEIEIVNQSGVPAISLKLNICNAATGERILPAYVSDGYFHLLPGERRHVSLEFTPQDAEADVSVEGYNVDRINLLKL